MATSALSLLLFLSLLAATASARPCKTLFYFSATTTTFYPQQPRNPNNSPNSIFQLQNPRHFTLILTTTTQFFDRRPSESSSALNFPHDSESSASASASEMTSFDFPLKLYSSVSSSIRDRTKDIMSVVGALLFGVACGALTAATMYFFWAIFSTRSFDLDAGSDSEDDDEYPDDVEAAKRKLGEYVAIPDNAKAVEPAKEVV